jgi:quercetin dioxygenase-like cupin family protein
MDARGFVVLPGQGPGWNMEPGRLATFKMESGETGGSAAVFEEVTPSGTMTPYHLRHDSDEIIYVLDRQMSFKIGEEVTVGGPGTYGFMPRGIAHAWKNSGAGPGSGFCARLAIELSTVPQRYRPPEALRREGYNLGRTRPIRDFAAGFRCLFVRYANADFDCFA